MNFFKGDGTIFSKAQRYKWEENLSEVATRSQSVDEAIEKENIILCRKYYKESTIQNFADTNYTQCIYTKLSILPSRNIF